VGILIDNSLNLTINDTYKDSMENILGFNVDINGISVYVASVYGPNDNDKSFFSDLALMLSKYPNTPYIIGGDWNATYSTADVLANIDIINMQSPPSRLRSSWLNDISSSFGLVDPYRALHPTRRDFTFLPKGAKKNRSRLDFFLISHNALQSVRSCTISDSLACLLFDHKYIRIDFTHEKTSSKLFINRIILSNARTEDVVLAAYADTYLSHADPTQPAVAPAHCQYVFHQAPLDGIEAQKVAVGTFIRLLKDFNELTERLRKNPSNNLLNLLVAEKETEISLRRELIWSVERYSELNLSCEHDFFFEALASNIKGAVISFQS
jgi:hypothetical protein